MSRSRFFLSLLIVCCSWLYSLTGSEAASRRELGLAEIAQKSGQIFHGECVAKVAQNVAGRPRFVYEFSVSTAIKGVLGERVTFAVSALFSDVPQYKVGQEYLLLLYPPSARGLTSPVGLDQGTFTVAQQGEERVVVLANRGRLFKDVSKDQLRAARIDRSRRNQTVDLRRIGQLLTRLVNQQVSR